MRLELRHLILILPLLGGGAFNCAAQAQSQPLAQTQSHLDEGVGLLSQGRFNEAIALFNRFKQTHPQDARPYFYSALALAEAGRLTAAALELGEAVRLDPQRLEYLVLQASLFARLKQRPAAEETLNIILKSGAAERLAASWLWLLSDVYFRLERFPDALRALDLLEKREPEDPRLDLNRGQAYALRGQLDPALAALRKSLAKHPGNPLAHFELGKLLYQRGDLPAAKKALLEAVRLEPKQPQYLQKLGAVCLALKEIDEALVYLERAVALDAGSSQIYYSLGQAYGRKGEREKAAEARQKFQALKQREEQAEELERTLARGERMLDEGKDAEARAAFEQVIQSDPNNWAAHGYLAELFLTRGDWQKAWPHLAKMEEVDAESVVGNYLLARHWYLRQDFERARAYAEKVKLARPAHAALRYLLGQIYLGLGQREQAIPEFEEAVRLAPERADFRENLQKIKLTK
jgi:tetratricopeptide (TPR) repeat protein